MDEWKKNEGKYILSLLNPSKGKIINTQFSHRFKFMKELVFKLGGQGILKGKSILAISMEPQLIVLILNSSWIKNKVFSTVKFLLIILPKSPG